MVASPRFSDPRGRTPHGAGHRDRVTEADRRLEAPGLEESDRSLESVLYQVCLILKSEVDDLLMARSPFTARIGPLPAEMQDEQATGLLAGVKASPAPATNIFSTLVRHPELFRNWLPLPGQLMNGGTLPDRHRELLILRAVWLCNGEYPWAQHREISRSLGISDEEISRVREGATADWDPFESSLLKAVDELHAIGGISDATWEALSQRYDERQLIELPMLVGHYCMVAFVTNSLKVPLEPGLAGFDN
jgi:4-carboxymuconolactone decarboxylase